MLLIHVLSGELLFVLMPFTRLSHVALILFERAFSDFYLRAPVEGRSSLAVNSRGKGWSGDVCHTFRRDEVRRLPEMRRGVRCEKQAARGRPFTTSEGTACPVGAARR